MELASLFENSGVSVNTEGFAVAWSVHWTSATISRAAACRRKPWEGTSAELSREQLKPPGHQGQASARTPGSGRQVGNTGVIDGALGAGGSSQSKYTAGWWNRVTREGKTWSPVISAAPASWRGCVLHVLQLTFRRSAAGLHAGCTSALLIWSCQMVSLE